MNRFRTRKQKKAADVVEDGSSEVTAASIKSAKASKKKKNAPEAISSASKIDISAALPDTNDFRTSLLMPSLSTRFSMLREQDDPTSKLGKASDDSVLFPKRVSRLNLFGHSPLADVPEVSSINDTIRPPFAFERTGSFASEMGSEDGFSSSSSITRSRPGEGNTMFGGRQKIYQIPIAASSSVRNLTSPETAGDIGRAIGGRARYHDDITEGRFGRRRQEDPEADWTDYSKYEEDQGSPASEGSGINRGTSSSTAASNKRDSTAATSVASQTPASRANEEHSSARTPQEVGFPQSDLERTATINKRLYGKVDKSGFQPPRKISNPDTSFRQPLPMNTLPKKALSQSKSAHNLNERFSGNGPVYASSAFRTASPPPSAIPSGLRVLDNSVRDAKPNLNQGFGYIPPLSPPVSESDDVYTNSVQPEDRGKATALGLFNRPQQYDENQFSQRQKQLYQDRESPLEPDSAPNGTTRSQTPMQARAMSRAESRADFVAQSQSRSQSRADSRAPSQSTIQSGADSNRPIQSRPQSRAESRGLPQSRIQSRAQSRAESHTHGEQRSRSRAESTAQRPPPIFNHQKFESRREEASLRAVTPPHLNTAGGTFYGDLSGSDDEEVSPVSPTSAGSPVSPLQTRQTPPPRMRKYTGPSHPFRSNPTPEPEDRSSSQNTVPRNGHRDPVEEEDQINYRDLATVKEQTEPDITNDEPIVLPSPQGPKADSSDDMDSPTLGGPGTGLGLSGLIRSHLRQDSDLSSMRSSVYPPPSPRHPPMPPMDHFPPSDLAPPKSRTTNPPASIHSNPWEFDDDSYMDSKPSQELHPIPVVTPPSMRSRAKQMLEQAQALKEQEQNKSQRAGAPDIPRPSQDSGEGFWLNGGKTQRVPGEGASRSRQESPATRPWQDSPKITRIPNQGAPPPLEDHPMNRGWHDEGPLRSFHKRGGSTETQRERDDFERELEERRKKVQESLKTHAEVQSRSASPVASLLENPTKPFAMLKPKSSWGSLREQERPQQSKAMKMLGLGSATMSSNVHGSPREPPENLWADEEDEMLRILGKARKASGSSPRADKQIRPIEASPSTAKPQGSFEESRERRAASPSSKSSRRDRSSSDMSSGRSKSRQGRYKDDLDRAMDEGTSSTTSQYVSAEDISRLPKLSMDPMDDMPVERSQSAMSGRLRSNSRATATQPPGAPGYFDLRPVPPIQINAPPKAPGSQFMGMPSRPSPRTPYSANSTPPLFETSPAVTPTSMLPPPTPNSVNSGFPATHTSKSLASRKRAVDKNLISEPTLLSSTSSINTVGLPPGASLQNGMSPSPSKSTFSPAIPPMNPQRRRGTTTQTIFGAFIRDKNDSGPATATLPAHSPTPGQDAFFGEAEQSTFSDEGEKRPAKPRQKLRKSSSEGGNLNVKARQTAFQAPSPALPKFPAGSGSSPMNTGRTVEGGMF